ncbi:MAG: type II toxin-antitoxin system RelE/ParE family toxin [Planctomycetia bacterium]|nr:type II toxin-antitoxin system RelE/ParE family toxin [Planctomycetia bacterium]
MAHVTITLPARDDLREVWTYVARDDMAAADRLIDRINKRCALHATQPDLGNARRSVRALHGARSLDDIFGR